MKRKAIISIILTFTLMMSIFATACSKAPQTLEEYIKNDSEAMDEVQQAADTAGLNVELKGNDVIYSYDLSTVDGVTEEIVKSDAMIDSLTSTLEASSDTFSSLCKQLEEQSEVEGTQIIVVYNYGEEMIVSKTFNSSGLVE